MKHVARLSVCWLFSSLLAALFLLLPAASGGPAKPNRPKLAVLIVFDQLRGDYFERWDDLFVADGFRRLDRQGAWFQNCHYSYSNTVTGAGHATIGTGCPPSVHGIVTNDWYDRDARGIVYCASTPRDDGIEFAKRSVSPERLLVPTLGDVLKESTEGRGKVVAISLKDRSTVMVAGRRRDHLCLWHDSKSKPGPGSTLGQFIRADQYYTDVPARSRLWVDEFNREKLADKWWNSSAVWEHLYPEDELDYAARCKPLPANLPSFPHPLRTPLEADLKEPTANYYERMHGSPFGNDLVLALAKRAIVKEELGRRGDPDLLSISFSSNDLIGHAWGPDSPEVLDVTLRSDLLIRELLDFLDAQVGKDRYVVCLTADHGVCPLPEVSHAEGKRARRILPSALMKAATEHLRAAYPGSREDPFVELNDERINWDRYFSGWLYFNDKWLDAVRPKGKEPAAWKAEVAADLAGWLPRHRSEAWAAYSAAQLLEPAGADALKAQIRLSYYPERSGDVAVIVRPYSLYMKLETTRAYWTTHGTPHAYDTHVPLLVYGPGVRPAVRKDAVTPLAAASILAQALGIRPPPKSTTAVPEELFEKYAD